MWMTRLMEGCWARFGMHQPRKVCSYEGLQGKCSTYGFKAHLTRANVRRELGRTRIRVEGTAVRVEKHRRGTHSESIGTRPSARLDVRLGKGIFVD